MLIIALDGPAGTGKSTVARALAARLGLEYLDTGAMYRAVTWAALQGGVDLGDCQALTELAQRVRLEVGDRIVLDDCDVTRAIRSNEVNGAVSAVASVAAVRDELVARQRLWASERRGGVLEGRDIGTVVFPDAALKVYLTAAPEVRTARRAAESGAEAAAVAVDLARRDHVDSSRAASPLTEAADAVLVDTSELSAEGVVDHLIDLLAQRGVYGVAP